MGHDCKLACRCGNYIIREVTETVSILDIDLKTVAKLEGLIENKIVKILQLHFNFVT